MLPGQAQMWPTATRQDSAGARNRTANRRPGAKFSDGETLVDAIQMWAAPNVPSGGRVLSAKDTAARGSTDKGKRQVGLEMETRYFHATPRPETTSGPGPLLRVWTPPECPRLNPRFSEWLMGWPVGLTAFELSETAWTRWWQATLSALSRLCCGGEPPTTRQP